MPKRPSNYRRTELGNAERTLRFCVHGPILKIIFQNFVELEYAGREVTSRGTSQSCTYCSRRRKNIYVVLLHRASLAEEAQTERHSASTYSEAEKHKQRHKQKSGKGYVEKAGPR